jgi:hypothetical protein
LIDLTAGINLSHAEIEQVVTASPPEFIDIKHDSVEFGAGFPNMVLTLWGYICTFRRFPAQHEFVEHLMRCHRDVLQRFDLSAAKARILRAFPSLTREIHFYSMALHSGKFSSVMYSAFEDVERGNDLLVGLGGKVYNVSCFVQTSRSLRFRDRKRRYRHEARPNSLDVILDLNAGQNINGWVFFTPSHVELLLNSIINYAWNHYQQHPLELLCS